MRVGSAACSIRSTRRVNPSRHITAIPAANGGRRAAYHRPWRDRDGPHHRHAALRARGRDRQLQQGARPTSASRSRPRPSTSPRSSSGSERGCSIATRAASARPRSARSTTRSARRSSASWRRPTTSPAAAEQGRRQLRISTSVAFGRRVVTPLALAFMREHPDSQHRPGFDDRYVNLVEQGIDVALRMGRLADSSLGARYLGINPWLVAAAPDYLERAGTPRDAGRPRARTPASSTAACRATTAGSSATAPAARRPRPVQRPAAQQQPVGGARRGARRPRPRRAALVRGARVARRRQHPPRARSATPCRRRNCTPSTRRPSWCPTKVAAFIAFLQGALGDDWWQRSLG